MILVTGATGNIGSEVVRLLVAGGHKVRVLARDPAKAARLGPGVEIVRGDLTVPSSLDPAMKGVERAFLVAHAMELPSITEHFSAAAERAGVKHVVLNSSYTVTLDNSTAIGRWHASAEEALQASEVPWTYLRPGNFSSNALAWAHTIKTQGSVFTPGGGGRSAPIDPRDIAAVAAVTLTTNGHEGKRYVLTGPTMMTVAEQVEEIAKGIGKPVKLVEVPEAGARAGMLGSGMTEVLADAVLELMREARTSHDIAFSTTVKDLTGTEARSFATWVTDNAAAFA